MHGRAAPLRAETRRPHGLRPEARAGVRSAPTDLHRPGHHLDLRHQHKLLGELRSASATVVCSLHDPQMAATYAGHVIVLEQGRVVADGSPAAVVTSDLLERVWGVTAEVDRDPDGSVRISITGIA